MARLDNAMTKAVNEMLKDARDVEIYSISAFSDILDITKCLNSVKTVLTRNKGKDITVVVSIR
jgi:hypothetical protein